MGIINVRIDDRTHEALRSAAEADGATLSEYVRDLLREAVVQVGVEPERRHGDEPAPESLRFIDRKVLSLLHRILGRVLPEGANDVDGDRTYQLDRARVLEAGFTNEYSMESAGFTTELSTRESRRVMDVLEMFSVVSYSVKRHADGGSPVDPDVVRNTTYRGFDHNDPLEAQMADYVEYLMEDGRWEDLKPYVDRTDGGNSHSPVLPAYLRMLAQYRRIIDSRQSRNFRDSYLLSAEEVKSISDARIHPSNRSTT